MSPLIIDDVFIEICQYFNYKKLLELQLLSKHYKELIRKTYWHSCEVRLKNSDDVNEKVLFMINNFNFMKYDLRYCYKITDETVKRLGNIHTLNLYEYFNITFESVKHLGKLHTLDLSYCYNITDASIKCLSNVHKLIL